jgi:hypothetical protein
MEWVSILRRYCVIIGDIDYLGGFDCKNLDCLYRDSGALGGGSGRILRLII